MRKLSGSSYSLIVVMIAMIFFMAMSLPLALLGSKFLPLLFGSIVFALSAIALAKEIKTRPEMKIGEATKVTGKKEIIRGAVNGYLRIAAWILGLTVAIYLLGFLIATLLFVGLYMKLHGSKWYMALISAVVFTLIMHALFNIALKADLFPGEIFRWLSL